MLGKGKGETMGTDQKLREPAVPVPDKFESDKADFMERIETAKRARTAARKAHEAVKSRRNREDSPRTGNIVS